MFLHHTPKDWAFQVHIYAYANNSQPLSELNVSLHEILFHTQPRLTLTFDLNLNCNTSKTCIAKYCSQLPEDSYFDKTDLNAFFHRILSKPIPLWFLAAMLQIYSTVYENTLKKITSHAYITKTYHGGKPLPIGTFVLKRNYSHVHFSDKLNPLRIGPYKILDRLSDFTYELFHKMALQYTFTETTYFLTTEMNHFRTHTYVVSCVSQTPPNFTFQTPLNMQIVTLPFLFR